MKFLYEYRTPDNAKHNGVICASDKEAAYAALKKQGIKPCRFSEAPGFFNKLFGKGKRWIAISVLGVGCLVLGYFALFAPRAKRQNLSTDEVVASSIRRQPIGDAAVIAKGIRTGWADVFSQEGDRFLASFAIPGVEPAVRSTTTESVDAALHASSVPKATTLEARQIVAIVEGMKAELRSFIAAGGSIRQYGNLLVERHEREMEYYRRAKREVDAAIRSGANEAAVMDLWEKRNASLRKLGIRLIPMPEKDGEK